MQNPINVLTSNNLLGAIFSYLDGVSLARTGNVCKKWEEVANTERLWKKLCEQHDLFPGIPLPQDEKWKQRFELSHRWRTGKCTEIALYKDGPRKLFLDKNIYRLSQEPVATGDLQFHDLETNEKFRIKPPNSFWGTRLFPNHILVKTREEFRIFNRQTKELIKSIPHQDIPAQHIFLSDNYFVVNDRFTTIWNIATGEIIWNFVTSDIKCLHQNLLFNFKCLQDGENHLFFMDLSKNPLEWQEVPHSESGLTYKTQVHVDQDRIVVIYPTENNKEIYIKRWNRNDLNQEPQITKIKQPNNLPIKSISLERTHHSCLCENIFLYCLNIRTMDEPYSHQFSIYAWDINTGELLFEKKGDGEIDKLYAQNNRILAEYRASNETSSIPRTGYIVLDFGTPTKITDPISIKNPRMKPPTSEAYKTLIIVGMIFLSIILANFTFHFLDFSNLLRKKIVKLF